MGNMAIVCGSVRRVTGLCVTHPAIAICVIPSISEQCNLELSGMLDVLQPTPLPHPAPSSPFVCTHPGKPEGMLTFPMKLSTFAVA